MTRRAVLLVLVGLSALTLGATLAMGHLDARREALAEAEARVADTARTVGEVLALRGKRERASLRARPPQDLVVRLNRTLTDCGSGGVVSNVAAHGGQPGSSRSQPQAGGPGSGGGGRYATQQVRATLRGLRLDELGRFLERWRDTQPLWTVVAIDVTRPQSIVQAGQKPPTEERFDASIVLATQYVAQGRDGRNSP